MQRPSPARVDGRRGGAAAGVGWSAQTPRARSGAQRSSTRERAASLNWSAPRATTSSPAMRRSWGTGWRRIPSPHGWTHGDVGGASKAPCATSSTDSGPTNTRRSASSTTSPFPSTTIKPSATCAWSRSSKRCRACSVAILARMPSAVSAQSALPGASRAIQFSMPSFKPSLVTHSACTSRLEWLPHAGVICHETRPKALTRPSKGAQLVG
jgi:hypothetical protein